MIADRQTIKAWFQRGLKPLAQQFAAWVDSFWHKDDTIPISSIENLSEKLNAKANASSLRNYQTKTDTSLDTTDKTIIGAINEINGNIPTLPDNVLTYAPQDLTEEQQQQARENIGATESSTIIDDGVTSIVCSNNTEYYFDTVESLVITKPAEFTEKDWCYIRFLSGSTTTNITFNDINVFGYYGSNVIVEILIQGNIAQIKQYNE